MTLLRLIGLSVSCCLLQTENRSATVKVAADFALRFTYLRVTTAI